VVTALHRAKRGTDPPQVSLVNALFGSWQCRTALFSQNILPRWSGVSWFITVITSGLFMAGISILMAIQFKRVAPLYQMKHPQIASDQDTAS
jgi:hypothetical protein